MMKCKIAFTMDEAYEAFMEQRKAQHLPRRTKIRAASLGVVYPPDHWKHTGVGVPGVPGSWPPAQTAEQPMLNKRKWWYDSIGENVRQFFDWLRN
jgi:hypothetical protein